MTWFCRFVLLIALIPAAFADSPRRESTFSRQSKALAPDAALATLREFLPLKRVEREFHIDADSGFRSWTLRGSALRRFLSARFPELENPFCIRAFVQSSDHVARAVAGIRMTALGVSEFVLGGEVTRLDLLPAYGKRLAGGGALRTIAVSENTPPYQCAVSRRPGPPRMVPPQ